MEITNVSLQTVQPGANVAFGDTVIAGSQSIGHRSGSGLITLRGLTNQCRARYKISFGGNIALPAGGTAGPISLALSLEGEPMGSTTMIVTPAAVEEFFNVFSAIYVEVPRGCCLSVGVRNTSTVAVDVQNANLIVERVA